LDELDVAEDGFVAQGVAQDCEEHAPIWVTGEQLGDRLSRAGVGELVVGVVEFGGQAGNAVILREGVCGERVGAVADVHGAGGYHDD
jgi:hypothetical protein